MIREYFRIPDSLTYLSPPRYAWYLIVSFLNLLDSLKERFDAEVFKRTRSFGGFSMSFTSGRCGRHWEQSTVSVTSLDLKINWLNCGVLNRLRLWVGDRLGERGFPFSFLLRYLAFLSLTLWLIFSESPVSFGLRDTWYCCSVCSPRLCGVCRCQGHSGRNSSWWCIRMQRRKGI